MTSPFRFDVIVHLFVVMLCCECRYLSFQMSVEVERKFVCNANSLKTLEEIGGMFDRRLPDLKGDFGKVAFSTACVHILQRHAYLTIVSCLDRM